MKRIGKMRAVIIAAALLGGDTVMAPNQTQSKEAVDSKILIFVSHHGEDRVGIQFVAAVQQELLKSPRYEIASVRAVVDKRTVFYVDISTIAVEGDHRSAASVVVENMGLPNSYPVPFKWYHKIFLLESERIKEISSQFVSDMDARWCQSITSSLGACPKESIAPTAER